jgi:hypothetical protein
MTFVDLVVIVVLQLCPNPDKMGYYIQDEEVNCMEYYTNDIVNHPDKYKMELENAKTK